MGTFKDKLTEILPAQRVNEFTKEGLDEWADEERRDRQSLIRIILEDAIKERIKSKKNEKANNNYDRSVNNSDIMPS